MAGSTKRGSILLTLAQAWHALSGYVVLTSAARILGQEKFGDFGLVAWTMTTIETFVVAGIPRAVSYFTARDPAAAHPVARRGMRMTLVLATALTLVVIGASAPIAELWRDPALANPVRLAVVDFIVFAPFAVYIQSVNGLRFFTRQASIWLIYSTSKVAFVVGMLLIRRDVLWGIGGYVIASAVGSIAATVGGLPKVRRGQEPRTPPARDYLEFGVPVACHSFVLASMLTLDLWAAKWAATDRLQAGAYVAASTLARVLYFVFVAFGEALFPGVARLFKRGQNDRAARLARDILGLLVGLLIPATALATGAAAPALALIYGNSSDTVPALGFRDAHSYLSILAPASSMLALVSVLASAIAAAGRPKQMAVLLLAFLAADIGLVFIGAHWWGAMGAAVGALVSAAMSLGATAAWGSRVFSANLFPIRSVLGSLAVAGVIHPLLRWWSPSGWLVLLYGAMVLAAGLAILAALGALPVKDLLEDKPPKAEALE